MGGFNLLVQMRGSFGYGDVSGMGCGVGVGTGVEVMSLVIGVEAMSLVIGVDVMSLVVGRAGVEVMLVGYRNGGLQGGSGHWL